jgi:mono/diheme cytochrome c family protein
MILRYFLLLLVFVTLLVIGIAGLRDYPFLSHKTKRPPIELFPDMVRQDKVKAQAPSEFFADGRGARSPIEGTVPMGYSQPDAEPASAVLTNGAVMGGSYNVVLFAGKEDYANTGKQGTNWGNGLPFTATLATLVRGHERYQIECAVCHGATGIGNGIATKYGLVGVANLQQQRLRDMSDGEIYNTLVNGKNTMLGYGANIQIPDRWAIIAYIRALQRSQNATLADVPADQVALLQGTNTPAATAKPIP